MAVTIRPRSTEHARRRPPGKRVHQAVQRQGPDRLGADGNARWVVEKGQLVGTQGDKNAPGDLLTTKSFRDFEAVVTYRVEWPCNSGVWFRLPDARQGVPGRHPGIHEPGRLFGVAVLPRLQGLFLAANTDKTIENHTGWNTMKIRAQGDHLQIWLNGHQTADVHDTRSDSGKIGFQVHPGAEFASMKIVVREVLVKEL